MWWNDLDLLGSLTRHILYTPGGCLCVWGWNFEKQRLTPGGRSTRGGCTGESVLYGVCWHRYDDVYNPQLACFVAEFCIEVVWVEMFGWNVSTFSIEGWFIWKLENDTKNQATTLPIFWCLIVSHEEFISGGKNMPALFPAKNRKFRKWGSQNQDEIEYPWLAILWSIGSCSTHCKTRADLNPLTSNTQQCPCVFLWGGQFYRIDTRWQKDKRIQKS